MAASNQVKQYLAFWFQLGKKVVLPHTGEALLPVPLFRNSGYSPEFESCWQRLQASDAIDAYLEGTEQTITQLLTSGWDIYPCARCAMPVPMINLGISTPSCPCSDLPSWPNQELPTPRQPVNTHAQLSAIRDRLLQKTPSDDQS
jgi:hypothetical protein